MNASKNTGRWPLQVFLRVERETHRWLVHYLFYRRLLRFIHSSAFRPATPVNYMQFLQSLGQDRVELATFPSRGSPFAEMHTFSATSEQDADRISSYKGGLTAGGLVFVLLMLPRKDLEQLWKQNSAQTSKVNRWRQFSWKTPRSSESQTSITSYFCVAERSLFT